MPDAPVSPKANRLASPTWLDTRLVLGVLLVLVSVVVGARVLSSADRTQAVWVATKDLAPGGTLTESDLVREQVRLTDAQTATLLRAPEGENPYLGQALLRSVSEGEFVPLAALGAPDARGERQFTLNVARGHLPPDLDDDDVVDVYVTPSTDGPQPAAPASPAAGQQQPAQLSPLAARRVFPSVTVDAVDRGESGLGATGDEVTVVLVLTQEQVLAMVTAVAQGQIDLVRVRGVRADPDRAAAGSPTAAPSPSAAAG